MPVSAPDSGAPRAWNSDAEEAASALVGAGAVPRQRFPFYGSTRRRIAASSRPVSNPRHRFGREEDSSGCGRSGGLDEFVRPWRSDGGSLRQQGTCRCVPWTSSPAAASNDLSSYRLPGGEKHVARGLLILPPSNCYQTVAYSSYLCSRRHPRCQYQRRCPPVEISVAAHDTTGGMETKILEATVIARLGIDVYITKAGSEHSLRAFKGDVSTNSEDWLGTIIRSFQIDFLLQNIWMGYWRFSQCYMSSDEPWAFDDDSAWVYFPTVIVVWFIRVSLISQILLSNFILFSENTR